MATISNPPVSSSIFQYPPNFPNGEVASVWQAWFQEVQTNINGYVTAPSLSAPTGAGLVGYQAPYAGAVARTQGAKNADWVSVKDFGAVGDGVTDDTAAINAALQAGDTFIPNGVYLHTGLLKIPSGRSVRGAGWGGCGASRGPSMPGWCGRTCPRPASARSGRIGPAI